MADTAYPEALEELMELLRGLPGVGKRSAEAYLGLTRAYLERGESASAAKSYETARKLGAPQNLELEQKLNAGSH